MDTTRLIDDDDVSGIYDNGTDPSKKEELFAQITAATKVLVDELLKGGGAQDERLENRCPLKTILSDWQIDRLEISYERDEFDDKIWLGQGATAVVYAGFLKADGINPLPVAVKTKPMKNSHIPDVVGEVYLHFMARHHRIISILGMWYLPLRAQHALIVIERIKRTLADALDNDSCGIDRDAILGDTAAAIAHLHECGIVHRDVKAANILLDEDGTQAKLADFGTSRRSFSSTTPMIDTQQAGTPFYMPPEVRQNADCKATSEIDCWAFGLLICEVMNPTGRNAFVGTHYADLHGAAKRWASGICDKKLRVAALACIQREAKRKPPLKEVYLHIVGTTVTGEGIIEKLGSEAEEVWEMCNNLVGKKRPREVKIEIADGGGVSGVDSVYPSGKSQKFGRRSWKTFAKVQSNWYNSKGVEIAVENKTDGTIDLCRAYPDRRFQSAMRVERSTSVVLTDTDAEGGVFLSCETRAPTRFFSASLRNMLEEVLQSTQTTCTLVGVN